MIAQIVDSPQDIHRAKEERRFGAFVVDTQTRGCSCTRLSFMGVRGIYNGQVHLREVWVPVADRLGAEGEGLRRALESPDRGTTHASPPPASGISSGVSGWLVYARSSVSNTIARSANTPTSARRSCSWLPRAGTGSHGENTGHWADTKAGCAVGVRGRKILATEWLLESLLDLFRIYGGRAFETPDFCVSMATCRRPLNG